MDWLAEVDARDRPELERLRDLSRTEPGWRCAAAAEAALARHLATDAEFPESRQAAFKQLTFTARLVARIESWGGLPRLRGALDGDPLLDWL